MNHGILKNDLLQLYQDLVVDFTLRMIYFQNVREKHIPHKTTVTLSLLRLEFWRTCFMCHFELRITY